MDEAKEMEESGPGFEGAPLGVPEELIARKLDPQKPFTDSDGVKRDVAEPLKDFKVQTRKKDEDLLEVSMTNKFNFRSYTQSVDHATLCQWGFFEQMEMPSLVKIIEQAIGHTEPEHVTLEVGFLGATPGSSSGIASEERAESGSDEKEVSIGSMPMVKVSDVSKSEMQHTIRSDFRDGDSLVLIIKQVTPWQTLTSFVVIPEQPKTELERLSMVADDLQDKLKILTAMVLDDTRKTKDKTAEVQRLTEQGNSLQKKVGDLDSLSKLAASESQAFKSDLDALKSQTKSESRITGESMKKCEGELSALKARLDAGDVKTGELEKKMDEVNKRVTKCVCYGSSAKNGEYQVWNSEQYHSEPKDWLSSVDDGTAWEMKTAGVYRIEMSVNCSGADPVWAQIEIGGAAVMQAETGCPDAGKHRTLTGSVTKRLNVGDKIKVKAPNSRDGDAKFNILTISEV